LLKVKVIQNGKWLRWIPEGNHFSTSLEYKLISKLGRNSPFEVLYKCCSFSARYPLCIHDTYNKQNHTAVSLWSSTSYHHSVNPEFNHLPYFLAQVLHCFVDASFEKKLAFTTDLPNTKKYFSRIAVFEWNQICQQCS
jgi:hypothetical protein